MCPHVSAFSKGLDTLNSLRILCSADSWARVIAWGDLVDDQALMGPRSLSPDDRHRVKLHPLLGDPNSDYINANYIDVSGDRACVLGLWAATGASCGISGSVQQHLEEFGQPRVGWPVHPWSTLPDLCSSAVSSHCISSCSALSLLSHSLSAFLSSSPSPGHVAVDLLLPG